MVTEIFSPTPHLAVFQKTPSMLIDGPSGDLESFFLEVEQFCLWRGPCLGNDASAGKPQNGSNKC